MPIDGVTHIDVGEVRATGDALSADADELRGSARGLDEQLPTVPHDAVGLTRLFTVHDRAREAFDLRVADLIDGAGERAVLQVLDACGADAALPYVPLPESAR